MAWLFWFRSKGRAKHMIAILMAIIALQYIKDLFFIDLCYTSPSCFISNFLTASDFVAVPFYGYILVELCRPGSLKLRHIVLSLSPFILLPILYAATHLHWIFTILIALSTLYGIACAGWMVRELPRYHRRLKDEYSTTTTSTFTGYAESPSYSSPFCFSGCGRVLRLPCLAPSPTCLPRSPDGWLCAISSIDRKL